jgi:hypothetical protein
VLILVGAVFGANALATTSASQPAVTSETPAVPPAAGTPEPAETTEPAEITGSTEAEDPAEIAEPAENASPRRPLIRPPRMVRTLAVRTWPQATPTEATARPAATDRDHTRPKDLRGSR